MKEKTKLGITDEYSSGTYFKNAERHKEDSKFKANNFTNLFLKTSAKYNWKINSYCDVGCGSGLIIKLVSDRLKKAGFDLNDVRGYDVSDHVLNIGYEGIKYIHQDFRDVNKTFDLITLFDVFEHVLDPINFLKTVSKKCSIIGFHIPLDYSISFALRNMFKSKIHSPGHLIFLDIVTALNMITMSGIRIIDYEYTFSFSAPSGHSTILSKFVAPLRYCIAKLNPWVASKLLGGMSLIVIGSSQINSR